MNNDNDNDDRAKVISMGLNLQEIASDVEARLHEAAGERLGFVLVVNLGKVLQYISNTNRADGMALLEKAWKHHNRADINAHHNPEVGKE